MPQSGVVVRRSRDRFITRADGIETRHSFSFGAHYDAANMSFGCLIAHNDEHLQPGKGYPMHPHRGVEIVTWMVSGALVHEDSTGFRAIAGPGEVLCVSAGRGVEHSEIASPGASVTTRFVQMWLSSAPAEKDQRPTTSRAVVGKRLHPGIPLVVASGRVARGTNDARRTDDALRLAQPSATLHALRLRPSEQVELPSAPLIHVFVVSGNATVKPGSGSNALLQDGDAAHLTSLPISAVKGQSDTDILVWEMHSI